MLLHRSGTMDKRVKIMVIAFSLVLILALLAGCSDDGDKKKKITYTQASKTENFNGYVGDPEHGTESPSMVFTIGANESFVVKATVTLSWTDDEAADDSDPDELRLEVSGGGQSVNKQDTAGGITLILGANETSSEGDGGDIPANLGGTVDITVTCIECGFTPDTKNWGFIHLGHHDPGNDFSLTVKYEYLKEETS